MKTFLVIAALAPFYAIPAALAAMVFALSLPLYALVNWIVSRRLPIAEATPEALYVGGAVYTESYEFSTFSVDASNSASYPCVELIATETENEPGEVMTAMAANKPNKSKDGWNRQHDGSYVKGANRIIKTGKIFRLEGSNVKGTLSACKAEVDG